MRAAFIISVSIAAFVLASVPALGIPLDEVLATVDGEVVTSSDYRFFVENEGNEEKGNAVDEALLKKLIEEKIILHEALRRGIEVADREVDKVIDEIKKDHTLSQAELEKELSKGGVDINRYRKLMMDRLAISKLIVEDVDEKVIVTDKEIRDFYEANKMSYLTSPEEVEIEAVFLGLDDDAMVTEITDLKRKALRIAAQLKENGNFEGLKDRYPDGNLNNREGRLGAFKKGDLIPALDKRAFSMKKGETSEPIWVKDGVYILKLVNRSDERFKPIEQAKEEIYSVLFKLKRERLLNERIKELWEKASITIK